MKRMLIALFLTLAACVACSPGEVPAAPVPEQPERPVVPEEPGTDPDPPAGAIALRITVGAKSFAATLADNAAARAFAAQLPMSASMGELNGNEKYYYLPYDLPIFAFNPGTVRAGDLMLFGSNCLVLFYETFPTSYSYTRIGTIDAPVGLAAALGAESVTVRFEAEP